MNFMVNLKLLMLSAFTFTFAFAAHADENLFSPSADEVQLYRRLNDKIISSTSRCVENVWAEHLEFFKANNVSKFYGDRNTLLSTPKKRETALIAAGKSPQEARRISLLQQPISCVGLVRRCLSGAFAATGDAEMVAVWKRIDLDLRSNGVDGSNLINALQKLGWKIIYWNPDPSKNQIWDREDPINAPGNRVVSWNTGVKNRDGQFVYNSAWGMHASRYQSIQRNSTYYKSKVDDRQTLVGFDTTLPESFTRAPLFIGVAHSGYHVFPGIFGEVIEAHSMRQIDSLSNLERAPFNPLATGGAPRWTKSERYRSGLVAVPPGF